MSHLNLPACYLRYVMLFVLFFASKRLSEPHSPPLCAPLSCSPEHAAIHYVQSPIPFVSAPGPLSSFPELCRSPSPTVPLVSFSLRSWSFRQRSPSPMVPPSLSQDKHYRFPIALIRGMGIHFSVGHMWVG
ncbi:hypothetical protein HNY73_011329 [Argiope bruennichi]|uniref:Secreted protein n=1 Tax=Argiope bruennichi TaxID=94029 RepID=A0A8T0F3R5_ARGBR|nr:hypothetical protein HNY73_011329 [Argiope bruennichi]